MAKSQRIGDLVIPSTVKAGGKVSPEKKGDYGKVYILNGEIASTSPSSATRI